MFCNKCGKPNLDEASFCASCGAPLVGAAGAPAPPAAPFQPRTSGTAVASLVLGILGITALLGLILGIVSLVQINRSRGQLRGQGLAIAGICVSAFMLVAILPAMLFPVFMRARASARKTMCLENMKSISTAIQMYVTDYDALPPREQRPEVLAYFDQAPGQGGKMNGADGRWTGIRECHAADMANPYLRWPVVLDDYVRIREMWTCPDARLQRPARFINGGEDWLGYLQAHEGQWGKQGELCVWESWPPGWGGQVTDSIGQKRLAVPLPRSAAAEKGYPVPPMTGEAPRGVFVQSIAVNGHAAGLNLAQVQDPAWFVVCADGGAAVDWISTGTLAYPDICALECGNEACGWVDWEKCTEAADCGLRNHAPKDGSLLARPELRRSYSRHLGGVNIGFLDGHVKWFHSETVIAESPTWENPERGMLRGYGPNAPTSDCGFRDDHPGVPILY